MGGAETGSWLKKTLKSLCCSDGWSYGIFWRLVQGDFLLMTLEEAYYDEQVGAVIDMLPQVHMMGEGIIGQAAFTGKHRWLFSDAQDSISSFESEDIFQDDSHFGGQFSSGIKTIAVISVAPQGVVQFGSTQKISESLEFLDRTKRLFQEMENAGGVIPLENPVSSLNNPTYDINGFLASFISSGNSHHGDLNAPHGYSLKELMGEACLATNLNQSSNSLTASHDGSMAPLHRNLAHPTNQLETVGAEDQVLLSDKGGTKFQQVFLQCTPSMSTRSSEDSILTSFDPLLASETRVQDSLIALNSKVNTLESCRDKTDAVEESTFTSMYGGGGLIDVGESIQDVSGNLMDSPYFYPSIINTTTGTSRYEQFKPVDFSMEFSEFCPVDDLSQWFSPSPEQSISGMVTTLSNGPSQSLGVTSASSCLIGDDVCNDVPVKDQSNSGQSSIINSFNSNGKQSSGIMQGAKDDLFDGLGMDFGLGQSGECWEDLIMPVVNSATDTAVSECVSDLDAGSGAGPRKGLFSELGLKELLDGMSSSISFTKSSFEDQFSTTKRSRLDTSSVNTKRLQLASMASSSGSMNIMQPVYNLERKANATKKEVLPKSEVGLWIDDSYSINVGNVGLARPQKPEEPAKATRKRARPGESTRPRPKDRQQIQDRIKELRGIIPHGGKCSIDSLLDRTIKYMLFLQSVTKYADKLKQSDEPKLIGQETGVVLKDESVNSGSGGTTWAFEVGSQTMVCPIIVEDLNPPGQMLIEMLCEERGFFLEIADVIRGFQLNILKGVMEARDDKIWARFIVEASSHVTRIDIFLSLVQLLKQTTAGDETNQPNNTVEGVGIPLLDCYQKPTFPRPISLAETLGC